MGKNLKKLLTYFFISLIVFFSITLLYLFIPKTLESLDNRLRDFMFVLRGTTKESGNIVIIDIDDKSLEEIGQWPWSRDVISKLLIKLTNSEVGLIGFDMVFAEEDRANPIKILEKYKIQTQKNIPNYDKLFAETIANTPTILGYQFQLDKGDHIQTRSPQIPAIFIEKNKLEQHGDMVNNAFGTILNTPLIQQSGYSSGFFNNIPDPSGVVRSVPLLIRYENQLYPSLALEIIRVISNINKVYVNYDYNGVSYIKIGDFTIPTDRYGRAIVNFRGPTKTFQYISAIDILNNNFKKDAINGKIALIGTSAAGLLDLRAIPLESVYPGVEVHANVLDNILTNDYIVRASWIDGFNLLHILLLTFILVFIIAYSSPVIAIVLVSTIFALDMYLLYYTLFTKGIITNILFPLITIIFATIAAFISNYFLETKYNQSIKNKFASKVSKDVMDSLLENPDDNSFAAMEKEITVFFSDVRNFTNISEAIGDPKTLIEFLNEYMDPMTDIIINQNGTIDKFIGDAIMAYWNAPGDVEDHANKAVIATLEQLHLLDSLNEKVKQDTRFKNIVQMAEKQNVKPIDIGIGLNTGIAVAGEMGSSQRSDYTVIGDAINLGARLESLCKYYDSKCNISEYTKSKLNEVDYIFRFLDLVTVKGKLEPIEIWQIIDYNRDESLHKLYNVSKEKLLEEVALYHKAIALYKKGKFKEALELFRNLEANKEKTNKKIYKIYIERCEHYIDTPPENFSGVFVHKTKG